VGPPHRGRRRTAQTIIRTAFGAAAREAGDVSAGLFLTDGRMIAQAITGTPGHVNSVAESMKHFLAEFPADSMRPGDIYITNDPWKATGHLFDITVVTPVFDGKRIVALFASNTHVVDIGGLGVGPDATQIYHEGLFIPIAKLAEGGVLSRTVLDILRANVRDPVQVLGDVYALVACNEVASRRLLAMMREYGLRDLHDLGQHIISQSHAAMLKAISQWPHGSYSYRMTVDGYDKPIELAARLSIRADAIEVDFAGTSGTVQQALNVPKSYTDAYTSFGVRCIIGPSIPNNAGSLAAVRVLAPPGSIVNAPHPCAVTSRAVIGMMLPDMVFGCLRQARPEIVPAEGSSSLWNIRLVGGQTIAGMPAEPFLAGPRFTQVSFTTGGTGARPTQDGLSTTSFPSGVRNTAVEITETMAPVVFWRKEYRPDSGGAGTWRGGLGQVVEVSHVDDVSMILAASFDRIKYPARGALGGHGGAPGAVRLDSGAMLKGKGRQAVPAGTRLIIETPGGGGIGDPRRRTPEKVRHDLENGLISAAAARKIYGARVSAKRSPGICSGHSAQGPALDASPAPTNPSARQTAGRRKKS
jgi:N-methylhydantoinase B